MFLRKFRALFLTAPLIVLATAVMGSVSLLVSLFDSSGHGQHKIARLWSRILLSIARVKVRAEGLEKIAPGGSYVFIANHRSYMDVPVVLATISAQFRFMANKNLFSIPFIGYHLHRAGHLPVDNANPRESLRSMTEAARVIQKGDISILIFPEGGRTGGELRAFKDGAAYIAIKSGAPVVPVALIGMRNILPMGSGTVSGGEVVLRVGEPAPTIDLSLQDRTLFSGQMRDAIARLLDETPESAELTVR
jgi:1-acyl-sn-glycerol-3-phosphate acyltransferase